MINSYNKRVKSRSFQVGDLVLQRVDTLRPVGKLDPTWEGPYKVTSILDKGAYELEDPEGRPLPRPWNVHNLKKYFCIIRSLWRITESQGPPPGSGPLKDHQSIGATPCSGPLKDHQFTGATPCSGNPQEMKTYNKQAKDRHIEALSLKAWLRLRKPPAQNRTGVKIIQDKYS
ncbi:UNVERIFIED_CONTAM: hypothetical protein Slati_0914000 [Sesamum latifolium]|uniref:Gag-pol polyprotein n=1 Tax=Sesamum latifolium TaxID=2727402 RepID=A0AAW2XPC1_9LAMI